MILTDDQLNELNNFMSMALNKKGENNEFYFNNNIGKFIKIDITLDTIDWDSENVQDISNELLSDFNISTEEIVDYLDNMADSHYLNQIEIEDYFNCYFGSEINNLLKPLGVNQLIIDRIVDSFYFNLTYTYDELQLVKAIKTCIYYTIRSDLQIITLDDLEKKESLMNYIKKVGYHNIKCLNIKEKMVTIFNKIDHVTLSNIFCSFDDEFEEFIKLLEDGEDGESNITIQNFDYNVLKCFSHHFIQVMRDSPNLNEFISNCLLESGDDFLISDDDEKLYLNVKQLN